MTQMMPQGHYQWLSAGVLQGTHTPSKQARDGWCKGSPGSQSCLTSTNQTRTKA